jgi:hypothetical protein
MKVVSMRTAMTYGLIYSLVALFATATFAQDRSEQTGDQLSNEAVAQEIDQELLSMGQNPNASSQSSSYKKVTKSTTVQTSPVATPVVIQRSTPAVTETVITESAGRPRSSKTVVTTKTMNSVPVLVKTTKTLPAKTTTSKVVTTTKRVSTQPMVKVQSLKAGNSSLSGTGVSVQKQPTTFIEASPLSASRADEIRRKRQDEELRTESKIVEKLEQSRIEDERRRAEALFGDRLDQQQQPAESTLIDQESTAMEQSEKAVAEEMSQPMAFEQTQTTNESQTDISNLENDSFFNSKYVGLTAGIPTYPDYQNVKGNYNVGIKFGMGHDRFLFELGLSMAQFVLEDSYYGFGPNASAGQYNYIYNFAANSQFSDRADFELKQYSGSLGGRYQILDGFIRPNIGGEFVYSYRQYSSLERTLEINSFGATTVLPEGTSYGNSHALDFGVLAGVDLAINPSFTLGADFKYLINVAHRINGENSTNGTPLEKLAHFVGGLSATFQF